MITVSRNLSGHRFTIAAGVAAWVLIGAETSHANESFPNNYDGRTDESFWSEWLDMVSRTQNEQPHWITPLVTTTPLLTQSFHYDLFVEQLPGGARLDNYGGGKGLEIIPTERTEVILAVPPYEQRTAANPASGVGAWPAVLLKYRFLSANEQQGDYALTGFLQFIGDSRTKAFSAGTDILQPTIAAGKGWGDFDLQMNLGEQFPLGSGGAARKYGKPVLFNLVAQYKLWNVMWPELEANYTWWPDGSRNGQSQLFLTPGTIFGPFPIRDRLKFVVGVGWQLAVTPRAAYHNNIILTVRMAF